MFSEASFILFTGWGGRNAHTFRRTESPPSRKCAPLGGDTPVEADSPDRDPLVLTSSGGHCSASYWDTFLFHMFQIIFHLEYLPQGDQVHYHQWWDDIVHDYPFLYVHQIDQSELDICHGPTEQRIRYGEKNNMLTIVVFCCSRILK